MATDSVQKRGRAVTLINLAIAICAIVFSTFAVSYTKGIQTGSQDGYNKGVDAGYSNGYQKGLDEGYENGVDVFRSPKPPSPPSTYKAPSPPTKEDSLPPKACCSQKVEKPSAP